MMTMVIVYVLLVCLVLFIPRTKKSINEMDRSKKAGKISPSELVFDQHKASIWVKIAVACARVKTQMTLKRKFGSSQMQINSEFKIGKLTGRALVSEFEKDSLQRAPSNKAHSLQSYLGKWTTVGHCSQIVQLSAVQVK